MKNIYIFSTIIATFSRSQIYSNGEATECYVCGLVKNAKTGEIYQGSEDCVGNFTDKDEFKIKIPTDKGTRVLCSIMETVYEEQFFWKNDSQSAEQNTTLEIYFFERYFQLVFENSTLANLNDGLIYTKSFSYGCGQNVTTCSKDFTMTPVIDYSDKAQPCGDQCIYAQVLNDDGDYVTVSGDENCKKAPSSDSAVCGEETRSLSRKIETFRQDSNQKDPQESSGICVIGKTEVLTKKDQSKADIVSYTRSCDTGDKFFTDGLFVINTIVPTTVCNGSLCNHSYKITGSILLLFTATSLLLFS